MMSGESVAQAYNELLDGIQPLCDEFTSTAATLSSLARETQTIVPGVCDMTEKIKASSQKVAENIAVAEGITFQANIVALDDADEGPELSPALGDLINSVLRVDSILADIAAASSELSGEMEQVNCATTQMCEITQSLEEQAQVLVQTVSAFSMNVYLAHA
jgi:methyl-accepting chemotaxis protein